MRILTSRSAFLALACAIVSYQIFVPPVVGLANNGDFGKVIGVFDLTGPVQDENAWADTRYEFNPKNYSHGTERATWPQDRIAEGTRGCDRDRPRSDAIRELVGRS